MKRNRHPRGNVVRLNGDCDEWMKNGSRPFRKKGVLNVRCRRHEDDTPYYVVSV